MNDRMNDKFPNMAFREHGFGPIPEASSKGGGSVFIPLEKSVPMGIELDVTTP